MIAVIVMFEMVAVLVMLGMHPRPQTRIRAHRRAVFLTYLGGAEG